MADQDVTQGLPEGLAKLMVMGGLPSLINHQDNLLTVNINEEEAIPNPLDGTVINPLFLDAENGVWVLYVSFKPGTLLPKHFHTGTVHFFTTKGMWHYVEYPDDKQTVATCTNPVVPSMPLLCQKRRLKTQKVSWLSRVPI